ncbi:tannase and feruloyl esterase [Phlyctema vagabunda]|uniref:Carboxylic ester hydrolase n=1 Tax=Phlyctema vagabunda TaxID=108571 RepID=A0ABR4P242_9HELO
MSLLAGNFSPFLQCNISAFSSLLPTGASVNFAEAVPLNGSFGEGAANLEFPGNVTGLPSLCAVGIHVVSSNESAYNFALFLPSTWNGRTMTAGNGGFGGGIAYPDMAISSHYGFAALSTDTGHISSTFDGLWALNAPETLLDWGYRALHGSVVLGKELVAAYYGRELEYSYYAACSTGGRQGFKEVEEFPDDFDGILVGAPAWWTTHLQTWTVQIGKVNQPADAAYHIPPMLFSIIRNEVLKQCDPQDGLRDEIISDPYGCTFDPTTLLCSASSNSSCLTGDQLVTLHKFYSDWVDTNQTFVFPGLALGAELSPITGPTGQPVTLGTDFVRYFLLNDTNWNWENFDYSIVQKAEEVNPGNATADNFDLGPYQSRGGKVIQYHGLADNLIPTGSSIYFHQQVQQTMDTDLDAFYRLFLVPGMGHCSGSSNAPWYIGAANQELAGATHSVPGFEDAQHDAILSLVQWVENGTAPEKIIATKFRNETALGGVERQRPLCVYPKQAKYTGSGDQDAAENWECKSLY